MVMDFVGRYFWEYYDCQKRCRLLDRLQRITFRVTSVDKRTVLCCDIVDLFDEKLPELVAVLAFPGL